MSDLVEAVGKVEDIVSLSDLEMELRKGFGSLNQHFLRVCITLGKIRAKFDEISAVKKQAKNYSRYLENKKTLGTLKKSKDENGIREYEKKIRAQEKSYGLAYANYQSLMSSDPTIVELPNSFAKYLEKFEHFGFGKSSLYQFAEFGTLVLQDHDFFKGVEDIQAASYKIMTAYKSFQEKKSFEELRPVFKEVVALPLKEVKAKYKKEPKERKKSVKPRFNSEGLVYEGAVIASVEQLSLVLSSKEKVEALKKFFADESSAH